MIRIGWEIWHVGPAVTQNAHAMAWASLGTRVSPEVKGPQANATMAPLRACRTATLCWVASVFYMPLLWQVPEGKAGLLSYRALSKSEAISNANKAR